MKRRGFLKLLALLPFAPKLAEALAQSVKQPTIDLTIDLTSGADQTSIWLCDSNAPTLLDVAKRYNYKHMLPVIETLSQKNCLLQDMVWKEDNVPVGHRVTLDTKWAHEQIDLWGKF